LCEQIRQVTLFLKTYGCEISPVSLGVTQCSKSFIGFIDYRCSFEELRFGIDRGDWQWLRCWWTKLPGVKYGI